MVPMAEKAGPGGTAPLTVTIPLAATEPATTAVAEIVAAGTAAAENKRSVMTDPQFILVFLAGAAVITGVMLLGVWLDRRKRAAFRLLAQRLQLTYSPERDYALGSRYQFLNQLNRGSNKYASHVLTGKVEGFDVVAFDYHYEMHSTDSKGHRTTHHHHLSVFATPLPLPLPEVTIRPEGMLSKIAQAFGYDDIDFESAEFSRSYCVRARDKRFAYDVCHPLAMEFLLEQPEQDFEIEGTTLASVKDHSLGPSDVEPGFRRLLAFRGLLPEHLLKA